MGLELHVNWQKLMSSILEVNKSLGKNFSKLWCDKMRSKSAAFYALIWKQTLERVFSYNDKLQLGLTQQNPKQKLFRLHRKIADRRGLWTRKQTQVIIWMDGRVVWSSPTSSSRSRGCRRSNSAAAKIFFAFFSYSVEQCVWGLLTWEEFRCMKEITAWRHHWRRWKEWPIHQIKSLRRSENNSASQPLIHFFLMLCHSFSLASSPIKFLLLLFFPWPNFL